MTENQRRQSQAHLRALVAVLSVCSGFALSCGRSTAPQYYLLEPASEPGQVSGKSGGVVGVGPIEFAEYLNRIDIIQRESGTRVKVNTTHLWAEPLSSNFLRISVENLGQRLGSDRVVAYPWNNKLTPTVLVKAHVDRFDVDKEQIVHLHVRWSLERADSTTVELHRSEYRERVTGKKMEDTTASMSRALAQFTREIAAAIE